MILMIIVLGFCLLLGIYLAAKSPSQGCDKSECDNCPFPPCTDRQELKYDQLKKMDNQCVSMWWNGFVEPVLVEYKEQEMELWITNARGNRTTYHEAKIQGAKFFKKI